MDYRRLNVALSLLGIAVLSLERPARAAAPPPEYLVRRVIHATPTDPNSRVALELTMTLNAADVVGNEVGWQVVQIEFRRPGEGGAPDDVWVAKQPVVDSPDGLWRVMHEAAESPRPWEFVKSPLLEGIAAASGPGYEDLAYSFEGSEYKQQPPYPMTAGLTYQFSEVGDPQPMAEGKDDPAEVPDNVEP